MANLLPHAKIVTHATSKRGHADHGWLNTYHTFSFSSYYDPEYNTHGVLRILNEDRVAPNSGFPTHPHRDFEIFSYILSGELTHRDSTSSKKKSGELSTSDFYRMRRGDVQFTTGGSGIAHSEQNEHDKETVHFLQIWVTPWKRGLPPTYHTSTFSDAEKRKGFVTIVSPLKAGPNATLEEEKKAVPTISGTIPIHADFLMGASIVPPGKGYVWRIGGNGSVKDRAGRKVYVHLPATKEGRSKVKLAGREDTILNEGDGAFISAVNADDQLFVESIGEEEAEVVVFDSTKFD